MFVNRKQELARLDAIVGASTAQLVALYGRRRIGKTTLLTHWLDQHDKQTAIYWVAHRSSPKILLARFSQSVQPLLDTRDPDFTFSSWEQAFLELGRLAAERQIVAIIDEWPYLLASVPGIATLLQATWDHHLKATKLVLILAGSSFHMMHSELLSPSGALYGRTTADLLLGPINPMELNTFLPHYSFNQCVETFSVIGGVPKYLEMWDDRKPVLKNIEETILSPVSIFRQEPVFLLQDELSDTKTYFGILDALGSGLKTPTQLSELTGVALPHLGKYLHTLTMLGLIRRSVPLQADDPVHSRAARYEIADPYLRFHFTFVRPNMALLEQERTGRLMQLITESMDAYVGKTGYEELCRRTITAMGDSNQLPFIPQSIGRIWDRHVEIDVAAVDHKSRCLLVGECKWTTRKMGADDLDSLIARTARLRAFAGYRIHYALFSRSGFDKTAIARAKETSTLLFEGIQPLG